MTDRNAMAREFQLGLRKVPDEPSADLVNEHWLLRAAQARIILEEALEAVEALGCRVRTNSRGEIITEHSITVVANSKVEVDIVTAAHELGDVAYSAETASVVLGLRLDDVFEELHRSNMSKILPDGQLLRHQGRAIDPHPQFYKPDIEGVIRAQSQPHVD